MSKIEALKESYGLLEHLVCELMVIFSGILCVVGIRHSNFKLIIGKTGFRVLEFIESKCYNRRFLHRNSKLCVTR